MKDIWLGSLALLASCGNSSDPFSAVIQVVAGLDHTCALSRSGEVRCWGEGSIGQLGYGETEDRGRSTPNVENVHVGGLVVQLAAGGYHTCALLDTGSVRCWGRAYQGELGYGNPEAIGDDEEPEEAGDVDLGDSHSPVVQLSAGFLHTCALFSNGKVRCWGDAEFGQLGYGDTFDVGNNTLPSSASDVEVGGFVTQIATGRYHTCALLDTGAVRCWGDAEVGQLGYGNLQNIGDDELPASAGDVPLGDVPARQIVAGSMHTCALLSDDTIRCWGDGIALQLGLGSLGLNYYIGDDETPDAVSAINLGQAVKQLVIGGGAVYGYTCALLDTGGVRCWGDNAFGQLGYGNHESNGGVELAAEAGDVSVGASVTQLTAGDHHTCALLTTRKVRCWGDGAWGQLGYGNQEPIGDDELPSSAGDVPLF